MAYVGLAQAQTSCSYCCYSKLLWNEILAARALSYSLCNLRFSRISGSVHLHICIVKRIIQVHLVFVSDDVDTPTAAYVVQTTIIMRSMCLPSFIIFGVLQVPLCQFTGIDKFICCIYIMTYNTPRSGKRLLCR